MLAPALFLIAQATEAATVSVVPKPLPIDATLLYKAADFGPTFVSAKAQEVTITSAEIKAPFPFTVALPSWNGTSPAGTGLRFALRVKRTPEATWSPWLTVGEWGDAPATASDEVLKATEAEVDVDTVLAKDGAGAFQWRYSLYRSPDATQSPTVSRLAICLTGDASTSEAVAYRAAHPDPKSVWTGVLPVPFTSQKSDDPRMNRALCSPTTTYMALAYSGAKLPHLEEFSKRVYSKAFDLFGVWPRAIAAASERGLPGYVSRIRNWSQLRAELAKGHPIGASVRFKVEDLERPPPYSTQGHLLLVRGFLPTGEIVVNDPASSEKGEGFVWLPEDFEKAWFGKGGVAYVFEVPMDRQRTGSVRERARSTGEAAKLRQPL